MDDLISRHEAIDAIYNSTADGDKAEWFAFVIKGVPSAEAVEVVRCRDCEHYFTSNLEMAKNHGAECTMMNRRTMPEDYCSYGQKM